jgi:hypothetical protein
VYSLRNEVRTWLDELVELGDCEIYYDWIVIFVHKYYTEKSIIFTQCLRILLQLYKKLIVEYKISSNFDNLSSRTNILCHALKFYFYYFTTQNVALNR